MKARVLNIGDEVLSGKTINTNAVSISIELAKIGIDIEKIVVTGDDKDRIINEVEDFNSSNTDILITTGGLGPTHDDITMEAVSEALGLDLHPNQQAMDLLNNYFDNEVLESNLKQIYFPKDAIIIDNKNGTADGAIINHNGKIYIILVGPPREMKPMLVDTVIPHLGELSNNTHLYSEFIVMGRGESFFEEYLKEYYLKYRHISINPYAGLGIIRFVISSSETYIDEYNKAVIAFRNLMKDYIISEENEEIEEVVFKKLQNNDYTISFAESITGGILASLMIKVSGASKVIGESFVTYSNNAKMKYLGVKEETLRRFSAVSSEVVREMAEGLARVTNANVCIAVSGVAGPDLMDNIEVGLVYYCIKINDKLVTESKKFKGNRARIRQAASLWIMYRTQELLG